MGHPDAVVTVFARNRGRLLLTETASGWDGLTRPLEGSPTDTAAEVIDRHLVASRDGVSFQPGEATHPDEGPSRHPVLVDVFDRELVADVPECEWRHASVLAGEEGAPGAWPAYRAVGPRVEGIIGDDLRGSTALSLASLELIRDEAANGKSWEEIATFAERIVREREELTALVVRIDRTMTRARERGETPAAVEAIAREEIDEAVSADEEAAHRAAEYCQAETVLTLSRSGTVQSALSLCTPEEVIFLESRPKREAVPVAERLAAEGTSVSLVVDAALGDVLSRRDIDLVMVGADSIHPNGDVRNKVGTRVLAMAAHHEGVPVIAVASSDKIAETPPPDAMVDPGDIYDGPQDIDTTCRMFDRTPPEFITDLVTEVGSLSPDITVWIAAERRSHRTWREQSDRLQSV